MKRSEVISNIYRIIHGNNPEYGGGWEADAAKSILKRIEELGMLPPINMCTFISDENGTKHSASKREWDDEE